MSVPNEPIVPSPSRLLIRHHSVPIAFPARRHRFPSPDRTSPRVQSSSSDVGLLRMSFACGGKYYSAACRTGFSSGSTNGPMISKSQGIACWSVPSSARVQ